MNIGQIYIIKNTLNKKVYIGQTLKFRKNKKKEFGYLGRFNEHINTKNPDYYFDREIKCLGKEHFYAELLEECLIKDLDDKEIEYIIKFNSLYPNGYNKVLGNPRKNSNSEDISQQLKAYYNDIEIKKKHSEVHKNKFREINFSDESIKEIDIKPIKTLNKYQLIYLYIKYKNNTIIRRRYGGIHISYHENYKRCIDDLSKYKNIKINDYIKNNEEIQKNTKLKNFDMTTINKV
jgi:hypothetical protein